MNPFFLSIAGLLSGICASMGLGGGFVLMIYLTMFTTIPQRDSQLINLLFFLPIAVLAVFFHHKNKLIETSILWRTILFGLFGVLLGSFAAYYIDETLLAKLFGAFITLIGIKELFSKPKVTEELDHSNSCPTTIIKQD